VCLCVCVCVCVYIYIYKSESINCGVFDHHILMECVLIC